MTEDNIDEPVNLSAPPIQKKDRIECPICKRPYQKSNKTNHLASKFHQSHINCGKRLMDIVIKYPEEHNKVQDEVYYL
jgi:hypothetical protein